MKIKQNDIHLTLNTKEAYAVIALIREWIGHVKREEARGYPILDDHKETLIKMVKKWDEL